MNKLIVVPLFAIILVLIDIYVFQAFKVIGQDLSAYWRKIMYTGYWGFTALVLLGYFTYHFTNPDSFPKTFRTFLMVGVFIHYFSKFFALIFLFIDDLIRAGRWVVSLFSRSESIDPVSEKIPRSEFLAKSALVAGTVPFLAMSFGIISGAHDYRIRRKRIALKNLPKAFDGIKVAQISDIHAGSFFNKIAVQGGIDMLRGEKPDLIFFTGDLVNTSASEVNGFFNIFKNVQAPLGVFSVTGNHDYGDYHNWPNAESKKQNFQNLIKAHELLGWDLLMNEHRFIELNGEKIAVIGIENWGAGRFSKYGKLNKAYEGSEEAMAKILLSHDPSHWDAQVRPGYPEIDLTLAGHTHGFQFGVEWGDFKWSPSQYVYKQCAGLYQENEQYLYVNRGYGYLGYPGRVGIPPEITILELVAA